MFKILKFSFKEMHLKMSSAKWRPFCLGLKVSSRPIPSHVWTQQSTNLNFLRRIICWTISCKWHFCSQLSVKPPMQISLLALPEVVILINCYCDIMAWRRSPRYLHFVGVEALVIALFFNIMAVKLRFTRAYQEVTNTWSFNISDVTGKKIKALFNVSSKLAFTLGMQHWYIWIFMIQRDGGLIWKCGVYAFPTRLHVW